MSREQQREIERRLERIESAIRTANVAVAALQQGLTGFWQDQGRGITFPGVTNYLINVTAHGESGPVSGATLTIQDSTSATILTSTTNAVGFCGANPPNPQGNNQYIVIVSSATRTRYVAPLQTYTPGTQTFYDAIHLLRTSTMTATDSVYGAFTFSWNQPTFNWQDLGALVNFAACGGTGCAAAANVAVNWNLTNGPGYQVGQSYQANSVTFCPQAGALDQSIAGWSLQSSAFSPIKLISQLPAGLNPGKFLYCTASPTLTITYP